MEKRPRCFMRASAALLCGALSMYACVVHQLKTPRHPSNYGACHVCCVGGVHGCQTDRASHAM